MCSLRNAKGEDPWDKTYVIRDKNGILKIEHLYWVRYGLQKDYLEIQRRK